MKKILLLSSFLVVLLMAIPACKKTAYDYDKKPTPVYSLEKLLSSINGSWQMQTATQTDELSLTKEAIDITDFFIDNGAKAPNITFKSADRTFSVDTAGMVQNDLKVTEGKFRFDDERFPAAVILTNASDSELTRLNVGNNLLSQTPALEFLHKGFCTDQQVMTVKITYTKKP